MDTNLVLCYFDVDCAICFDSYHVEHLPEKMVIQKEWIFHDMYPLVAIIQVDMKKSSLSPRTNQVHKQPIKLKQNH